MNKKSINYLESEMFFDCSHDIIGHLQFQFECQPVEFERIVFDHELFKSYIDTNNNDIDKQDGDLEDIIWDKLLDCNACVRPQKYDEIIAYKCNLIPFFHCCSQRYGLNYGSTYLILEKSDTDLSPKLDAYQALTSGTIDPNSKLFKDRAYFEQVVGVDLTEEVLAAISQS